MGTSGVVTPRLSIQQRSDALTVQDRAFIDGEITQLKEEINRIGSSTAYNGIQLFGAGQALNLQVGSSAAVICLSTWRNRLAKRPSQKSAAASSWLAHASVLATGVGVFPIGSTF
ncbi:hypothetical protein [Allopusillimonas ginsengisoli]|uniref:flagellin N-terminal helical domain-containing protein n=1 Tax=Allopusillimonas ginsengisoli TaxID=453575 RepID=UPI0010216629|nr:hypothetical protein ERE07_19100 [Allopusillimonas ginsengisoli]